MKEVSDKIYRENKQKTLFIFGSFVFESLAVFEKVSKNIAQPGRPQMTIRGMRIACWIPKATNTHSEYVILIAFSIATMVAQMRLNVTVTCTRVGYKVVATLL